MEAEITPPLFICGHLTGDRRGGNSFQWAEFFQKRGDKMAKTKKAFISEIKRQMKSLGTYKKEYDRMIEIFAGMLHQYYVFEEQFAESGYKITELYTNKAGATNERKTPLYTAMESLRKDIATYSDRLCLNPKALESITIEQQNKSKLAQVLSELS